MRIYNLAIGVDHGFDKIKEGKIWCTDGSFVNPEDFKKLNLTAYGYCLNDNTAVSLVRSTGCNAYLWSNGENFPFEVVGCMSIDGFEDSNRIKSLESYGEANYPAAFNACSYTNAGVYSYMPSLYELKKLYGSIMNGKMKNSLEVSGLIKLCNYRSRSSFSDGWSWIWSITEVHDNVMDEAYYVNYNGDAKKCRKDLGVNYVIPFFRF